MDFGTVTRWIPFLRPATARHARLRTAVWLMALQACGDPAAPFVQPCLEVVDFHAERTDAVEFHWSGDCGLDAIVVADRQGRTFWSIRSRQHNRLVSPIRYGVVPAGARELEPPLPLAPGDVYFALVGVWIGRGYDLIHWTTQFRS